VFRSFFLVLTILLFPALCLAGEWEYLNSGVADHLYGLDVVTPELSFAIGWGVSSGGVVVRSEDGGDNWSYTTLSANSYIFDITFTDDKNGYIAGCANGGSAAAIWQTSNGGDNWTRQVFSTSWGFYGVDFPSSDIGYACGWNGRIYKTSNGGDNWGLLSSGTSNVFRYLDFPDPLNGYAICGSNYNNSNMVYKTTNGTSWSQVKNFGSTMIIGGVHFFDADTGIIVGKDTAEAVLKTYDGGETWHNVHSGLAGYTLQGLSVQGAECIAVGHGGRILLSHDFGETWELDSTTNPVTTLMSAGLKDGAYFCAGTSGRIFRQSVEISNVPDAELTSGPCLLPNWPNPFNPSTQIEFTLDQPEQVNLEIFDTRARLVRVLINYSLPAGHHSVNWNGRNAKGTLMPSGVYFCSIKTQSGQDSRKLSFLK